MIEYKIQLAGCECSVAEWNSDAKLLVFGFHGWLDNLATFERLANYLPEVRLIAVDFPGHGHSAHLPPSMTYHFMDGLLLIDDLLSHFTDKPAILLGHSMGGAIASIYASIKPEMVHKLALIEALGPVVGNDAELANSIAKSLTQRRALKDKRKPVYTQFVEALNRRAEVSSVSPEQIRPLVERALTKIDEGYTWRADSRLRIGTMLRLTESQVRHLLPKITAQVLVIEGESGLFALPEAKPIHERKALVKHLACFKTKGTHHLHLEYPQQIANRLSEFLLG